MLCSRIMESLKEKTAKGLFWGGMNNGMQQLLGLVFGIILGRLLSPSDYGLIAMITIFLLIATALHNSGRYPTSIMMAIGIMSMIRMGRRLRHFPNTVLESSWVGVRRSLSPSLAYGTGCSILRARTAKSSPPALRIRYACDVLESLSLHP